MINSLDKQQGSYSEQEWKIALFDPLIGRRLSCQSTLHWTETR